MSSDKKPKIDGGALPTGEEPEQEVLAALELLAAKQSALDKVNEEASEKVLCIQQEYSRKRQPLYVERNAISRAVPDFWKTVLQNHPIVRELITEDDESALLYLNEILVEEAADVKSGFNIRFKFNQNPYFEDRELQKMVTFSDEGSVTVDGTPPKWLEGMGPSDDQTSGSKRSRANVYSFFQWFIEAGTIENGQHDEIASIIKDDIWPNPLQYYQDEGEDFEVSYQGVTGGLDEGEDEDEGEYEDEEVYGVGDVGPDLDARSISSQSDVQDKVCADDNI